MSTKDDGDDAVNYWQVAFFILATIWIAQAFVISHLLSQHDADNQTINQLETEVENASQNPTATDCTTTNLGFIVNTKCQ